MGDRGNIQVREGPSDNGVFFYAHWAGSDLPEIVKAALKRGRGRWGDTPYLARIIFSELIKDSIEGETGYGISTSECDPEHPLIIVDDRAFTVTIGDTTYSYESYVEDGPNLYVPEYWD